WTHTADGNVAIVYLDYIKGEGSFASMATTAEKGNPTVKKIALEPRGADDSDAQGLDFKSRSRGLVKSREGYLAFYGLSQKDKKIQMKVVSLASAGQ
ncbi:MAG: hypothetical protein ABIQ74_05825, partial [Chitinophagales bacterium]